MSLIYILRHGETQWNREEIFRGHTDIPLNDAGKEQAARAARALQTKPIRTIYSSPLKRAAETACIVANELGGLEVRFDEGLRDIGFGEIEGMPVAKVKSTYPELYETWRSRPDLAQFPGGEAYDDRMTRAWDLMAKIASDKTHCPSLLVTHRVICKMLIIRALGLGPEGFWKVRQGITAINALELTENGWVLNLVNDTCHLNLANPEL